MKIDSHQHFWRYNPARDRWITDEMAVLKRNFLPDELNRELDASGIDGSIAVQADQSEDETLFLLDLAKRYDTIAGVVGWVNLCAHNLSELLSFSRNVRSCADFGISYRQNRTIVSCCETSSFGEWHVCGKEDFRPYLDIVFESFGPDRLMFGAVCLLAARMGKRTG